MVLTRDVDAAGSYAGVLGVGLGNDSVRAPAPDPRARGVQVAVRRAMELAGGADLSHVVGHGSGTVAGDASELSALCDVLPSGRSRIPLFSAKSQLGHLGPAAGLLSTVVALLALQHGELPATRNLEEPDPGLQPPLVPSGGPIGPGGGLVVSRGVEGQAGAVVLGE